MDLTLYRRVRAVAVRACAAHGLDKEWADDVAQDWALGVLCGAHGADGYSGRAWYRTTIVARWIKGRARPHTLADLSRYVERYAWRPPPAIALHDLRAVWESATEGERGAILSLLTMPRELPPGWRQPSQTTAARKRRNQLLCTVRKKHRKANAAAS